MGWDIELEILDMAPSVNSAYYFIRKGKRTIKVKTPLANEWIQIVKEHFKEKYSILDNLLFNEKLELSLEFYFTDDRRHDVDNFQKITIDALTKVCWADDTQIQKITSQKYERSLIKKTIIKVRRFKSDGCEQQKI